MTHRRLTLIADLNAITNIMGTMERKLLSNNQTYAITDESLRQAITSMLDTLCDISSKICEAMRIELENEIKN